MDLGLQRAVVLVAGSTRGIGRAVAWRFAAEGAYVAITGRTQPMVVEAEEEFSEAFGEQAVLALTADMNNRVEIEKVVAAVVKRWSRIDVLIANVGGVAQPGWDISDAEWASTLEANFIGSMRVVRAVIPVMASRERGAIVLTSSIAGLEDLQAPVAYSSAKAALIAAGGSLARLLGPNGIRVNAVAPGNVLFPGGAWEQKLAEQPIENKRRIDREVALQRFGTPEEIADVIVFLASPRAAFVTGACWVVDGGQLRRFA